MTPIIPTCIRVRSRFAIVAVAMSLLGLNPLWVSGASAQQAMAEQPVAMTRGQADAIVEELKAIRKLLESIDKKGIARAPQRPRVPPTAKVSVENGISLGSIDAPVTVVEFTDYQCPYCLRFVQDVFPKLKEQYIDSGKVRWVIRDLPLGFHKSARKAAQAARCAGDQGRYWDMHSVLFANAKKLEEENLSKYAQIAGLDADAFGACLASDRHLAVIDKSIQEAGAAKITGTPTFVIGRTTRDSIDGERVVGARSYKVFEAAILKKLAQDQPAAK